MRIRNFLSLPIVALIAYLSSGWITGDPEQRAVITETELSVGLLKVQSDDFQMSRIPELVSKHSLDVFLSTGTRIQQDSAYQVLQESSPEHFSFYFDVGESGTDGVAVHFSEELLDDLFMFDLLTTFRCVVLELRCPGCRQPVLLITVQRVEGGSWTWFLTELQELLDQVVCYDSVMLSGDFQQPEGSSGQFEDLLKTNGLVQLEENPVFSRNMEISDLSVNADSHRYITFKAKPQSKNTSGKKLGKKRKTLQTGLH